MKNWELVQYGKLINKVLSKGEKRKSRAGDVYSLFGEALTIDVGKEFPLLQGRKIFYKGVLGELAAMFRGPKSVGDFRAMGCNYWDAWGSSEDVYSAPGEGIIPKGTLNLDYGNAWIDFNGVNQLENLVKTLQTNPTDRRMLITGWRPDRLAELSLPCCHLLYQWYVREGKYLDMVWYQRSVDTMVGLPSDVVLAAAWNILLANQCGYTPGIIKLMLGDTHIYANHLEPTLQYMRQLESTDRRAGPITYAVKPDATVFNFLPDMIQINNYKPKDPIQFTLNV